MCIQDPISNLLTQIRNGYMSKKICISVFSSKMNLSIVKLLVKERFLERFELINPDKVHAKISIYLKYYGNGIPILKKITRISKPSMRVYKKSTNILKVLNGFGIAIISTNKGLLTDTEARDMMCGGEIVCTVE